MEPLEDLRNYVQSKSATIKFYSSKIYTLTQSALLLSIPICLILYLFGSLINSLVPAPGFTYNLHFDYKHNSGIPTAEINVPSKELLTAGVTYDLRVDITVPESEKNFDVGAVMLSVDFKKFVDQHSTDQHSTTSNSVPATSIAIHSDKKVIPFRYSSLPLQFFRILVNLPLYIYGYKTEIQKLSVNFFDDSNSSPLIFSDLDLPETLLVSISNEDFHVYSGKVSVYGNSVFYYLTKVYFDWWPIFSSLLIALPLMSIYFCFILFSFKSLAAKKLESLLEPTNKEPSQSQTLENHANANSSVSDQNELAGELTNEPIIDKKND